MTPIILLIGFKGYPGVGEKKMRLYPYFILLVVLAAQPIMGKGYVGPDSDMTTFDQVYNPKTEVAFEGRVLHVDPAACAALPISNLHLHLISSEGPIEVDMGPCWYVQDQKLQFKKDDFVFGIGSKIALKNGVPSVIVAREIRRGNAVLILRDPTGKPVWRP